LFVPAFYWHGPESCITIQDAAVLWTRPQAGLATACTPSLRLAGLPAIRKASLDLDRSS